VKQPSFAILALLLACCGGGANEPAPPVPPPKKSRLVSFEPGTSADGLELPDLTDYWRLAEERNGNAFPIKAGLRDGNVMSARLDHEGRFTLLRGEQFEARSLEAVVAALEALAEKHWNEEHQASAAALLLLADARAPWDSLLKLCRELVNLRMRNLWLATTDTRDGAARLLPLLVDTDQVFNATYELGAEATAVTARLVKTADGAELLTAGKTFRAGKDWPEALAQAAMKDARRINRVQFHLLPGARVADFADAVKALAALGFRDVEPFWPALDFSDGSAGVLPTRALEAFEDDLGVSGDIIVPGLSDYWRAVAGERQPAQTALDRHGAWLGLRVFHDGALATRAKDDPAWTHHETDLDFMQALQRNAGEIDFDTGLSSLQVVMAIDRRAHWNVFLGVLEMMRMNGCHRLLVLTWDVIGPTLRLLDLSLPLESGEGATSALVDLRREGILEDEKYTLHFTLDGETHEFVGARFAPPLMVWAASRKTDPEILLLKLPGDEPFGTMFTVLDALAWLGMGSIRIGG
jgi:hypothetical protein